MLFLYNIPAAAMGALIVSATLAAALLGYAVFRRIMPGHIDAEQRGMIIAMMSAITTINSLLVAFSAVSVWNSYQAATDTVAAEAACASELAHDLAAFHGAGTGADAARQALAAYLARVADDEWPQMQQHARAEPRAEAAFDRMFAAINHVAPSDERERVLLSEVMARANEMVKYRQSRLQSLDSAMPATLWAVMLLSSSLSLLLLYALPGTRFNIGLVSIWAVTLGLAFFFVLAVDRPFAGEVSVSVAPIRRALDALRAELAAPGSAPSAAATTAPGPAPRLTPADCRRA
ncbi:bestrophin-like domain [Burkholderia stagnalis]